MVKTELKVKKQVKRTARVHDYTWKEWGTKHEQGVEVQDFLNRIITKDGYIPGRRVW